MARLLPLLIVLAGLLAAPAAHAAFSPEVGIEDERLLLGSAEAPDIVFEWRRIGVDVVRVHASWGRLAPKGKRKPGGFSAGNHRDRRYDWGALDAAVGLVHGNGMKVMLSVTGPGPLWTSPSRRRAGFKPKPGEFKLFAKAVATRYADQVDRYLIWNEPNLTLVPKQECSRRGCSLVAPHLYRGLVRAAGPAIKRADPRAEIGIGELAPIGGVGKISPLTFLRSMACVNDRYRKIRTGRCKGFRPAAGDVLGYHPHPQKRPPDTKNPNRQDAQFGDIPRLLGVIDRLTRMRAITAPNRQLTLRLTEFGYQTKPPDRFIGVSLSQQARYLQMAAYLASKQRRVKTVTQYQWRDEPVRRLGSGARRYAGWQSGLRFVSDKPKPAMRAFERPFVGVTSRRSKSVLLWGQVRAGAGHELALEYRPSGSSTWGQLERVSTDESGVWSRRLAAPEPGGYRFRLVDPATGAATGEVSGIVTIAARRPRAPVITASRVG